ncbi:hypothetical protein LEP1GSC021_4263 [Leptospira noguchii str. 1993005606]|nr:hypothetical protein LEP1GSC021_4263 [Leptospira noguchii str. 1993005606]
MDLNTNLSELRQILCKKIGPTRVSGGGGEVVGRFERFFSIRKTYFLQVKRLILVLVGTLEKCALILKSSSIVGLVMIGKSETL